MIAILKAKSRALCAINCVTVESVFGTALPLQLRPRVSDGYIDQLSLYRWAPQYIYPSSWEISEAAFVLVTPGGRYAVPDGWGGADSEAVTTLLLKAAERSGRDIFARAVAALIAPSGTHDWRGITASGGRRAFATFGLKRSWGVWLRELEILYLLGAGFGLAMRMRGWIPVSFDGVELDPADLPADALAAYAEALEAHGDRASWLTCTFCGASAEAACGHVDRYGSHVSSRPPLPADPAVAA